ncbi:glycosyltransferase [Gemmatimonadota bacterium]
MTGLDGLRVALVHDWLITWGGGESVLQSLANLFPEAPIYTSLWNPVPRVEETFGHRDVRTTWLQSIPGAGRNHRKLLPLMPRAFEALDLSEFDLVISDSHAFSKAVRVRPDAVHVCYCHTPPRYLWDLRGEYLGVGSRISLFPVIRWLQRKDLEAAAGVTRFLANSRHVADRIQRVYGRPAEVVYPPVDVAQFSVGKEKETEHILAGGRLVGYKRLDLAVSAATQEGLPLRVFGDGPELKRLKRMAGPTVEFLGYLGPAQLRRAFSTSRAFIFPGVEDFGILPVEAQAAGRPVLAYGRGGALESVADGETGLFFREATASSLLAGLRRLEGRSWDGEACRANANRFSRALFEEAVLREVQRPGQPSLHPSPGSDGSYALL